MKSGLLFIFLLTAQTLSAFLLEPVTIQLLGKEKPDRLSHLSRIVSTRKQTLPGQHIKSSKQSTARFCRGGTTDISGNESSILQDSVIVGTLTAAMGFLYGKVLSTSVHSLWHKLPAKLIKVGQGKLPVSPVLFMTLMCATGGLLVGLLSILWEKDTFTVADFVQKTSTDEALPSVQRSLLPLLILSMLTSSFGFSVGPEAPMVCAGALVGAAYANKQSGSNNARAQVLSYAGAAGALTAFMGIPLAGSIFALELTQKSAGIGPNGASALGPAAIASCAGLVLLRGIMQPRSIVGGHFLYPTMGPVMGSQLIASAIGAGFGGAFVGTVFVKLVSLLKGICWPTAPPKQEKSFASRYRPVLIKTLIGVFVGLLSSRFPQTLFWGEGSLQCVVDGQATAFAATKHGIPSALTAAAAVNPNLPFDSAMSALKVGMAKLLSISLACAGKFPGGIIFPLFFAAAPLAHALSLAAQQMFGVTFVTPMLVMALMASTQASVTKTPLATSLILALSASPFAELSVLWPACLVASYVGVWVSERLPGKTYFAYE